MSDTQAIPDLDGLAIVVTGGAQGLGAAYARYLALGGARVILNDVDAAAAEATASEIAGAGGTVVAHAGDVGQWGDAAALIERCVTEFGVIDGLVNNAGIVRLGRPEELQEAMLRQVIETNLLGTAFCSVHAVRRMLAQGHGSIVNVTSGSQAGWPLMSAYAASKGGIASLTYTWAMDLAGSGVRVNAVSPVGVTRLRDHFAEYLGEAYQPKPGPDPANNAPAVAYLLSGRASGVNGQVVRIDGRELSLMSHAAVAPPVLRSDGWTFEEVAHGFEATLLSELIPPGATASATAALSAPGAPASPQQP